MLPILPAAIILAAPPAPEPPRPVAAFCEDAVARFKTGDLSGGLKLLDEALKAHPRAAQPRLILAQVHLAIAAHAGPQAAIWHRRKADDELEAIYWNPDATRQERINMQILMEDAHAADVPQVSSKDPEALKAFQEAETHFSGKDFPKARAAYARALEKDPGFVLAMLYMGDTYHGGDTPQEAVAWFRKAAQAQPGFPTAWRYLSDAFIEARQLDKAEEALMAGLAGQPGNRLLWLKLASLRDHLRRPMRKLEFAPPYDPRWDDKGQLTLAVTHQFLGFEGQSIWPVLLSGILGGAKVEVTNPGKDALPLDTPFQREIFFWDLALQALDKHVQETREQPQDRFLGELLRFRKEGRLEAALFLLRYQEAFRPDFEAWKKAHPGQLEAFIREAGCRP